ncbi:hypothetical protein ZWY2020_021381 [Hordeum vulgare]|nr:hypothetical protein ZWY2020_021381 [Hordeum vulgare]
MSSVMECLRFLGLYRFRSDDFPPEYNYSHPVASDRRHQAAVQQEPVRAGREEADEKDGQRGGEGGQGEGGDQEGGHSRGEDMSYFCSCAVVPVSTKEFLLSFYKANKSCKPGRIIFYRDGVSEGQFSQVLLYEMDAIYRACSSLENGYLPQVTFVVVHKISVMPFLPRKPEESPNVDSGAHGIYVIDPVTLEKENVRHFHSFIDSLHLIVPDNLLLVYYDYLHLMEICIFNFNIDV